MNDEKEWEEAMEEAARTATPKELRRLYASMLIFCEIKDPIG